MTVDPYAVQRPVTVEAYERQEAVEALLGEDYWAKKLNITVQQPLTSYPDPGRGMFMRYDKRPRQLLVIEGESEFVQPYADALAAVYHEHKDEYPR